MNYLKACHWFKAFLLLSYFTVLTAHGQTNFSCTNAVAMVAGTNYFEDTTGAPPSSAAPDGCGANIVHGVWYTVTTTNNQRVIINTSGSTFPTYLSIYTNTCGALSNIACIVPYFYAGNGQAGISFSSVSNATYYILAGGLNTQSSGSGTLHITADLQPPPVNDTCAGALPLTNGLTAIMDTTYATEVGDNVDACSGNISHGVWFTVTPTNNQRVVLDTSGSTFPTYFAVYTNTCDALSNIACIVPYFYAGNGQAGISFSSLSNITYHILVGGLNTQASGSGMLHITANLVNPPVNDLCAGALPLTSGLTAVMDTTYATEFGDNLDACSGNIVRGVWFTVTATNNQRVLIDTSGSTFPTYFVVYTNICGALSNIACIVPYFYGGNGQASISFSSLSNVTYHILVGGLNTQATGGGMLHITANLVNPPLNDLCTGALPLTNGLTAIMDTTYATEFGDNLDACSTNIVHGVWFTVTSTNNQRVMVNTTGSTFPTYFSIYTNTCGALSNFACVAPAFYGGNGQASVSFSSVSNVTYYILAGGLNTQPSGSGMLYITADLRPPPVNDTCAGALPLTNGLTAIMDTTYATEIGDNLDSCSASIVHGVWFTVTPTNNQRVIFNTTGSTFPTYFSIYTNTCGALSNFACVAPAFYGGNGQASVSFPSVSNVTYYILAGGLNTQSSGSGMLYITANLVNPPGNDLCAGAIPLTNGLTAIMDTTYATEFGDNLDACSANIVHGVWFTVTSTNNQRVVVNSTGSTFPTYFVIYTNTCGNLSNFACVTPYFYGGNGQASVSFSSVSNVTYHILAGGLNTQSSGSGTLHITADLRPPPVNDTCAGALPLTNGIAATMDTTYVTELGDNIDSCSSNIVYGVWFTVTPTNNQRVIVNTTGSTFPTYFSVYTNTCGALSNIGCVTPYFYGGNGQASLSFTSLSNITYHILAGGYVDQSIQKGTLNILADLQNPPANDACIGAIVLTNGVTNVMDTTYATELNDPTTDCNNNTISHGVWFALQAFAGQPVTINTCGSGYATDLMVFTNGCGTPGNAIACSSGNNPFNCNNAGLSFTAPTNLTYYILASGVGAASGTLRIVANVAPPTNDACSGAIAMTNGVVYSNNTIYATSIGDPAPACAPNLGRGVWYSYRPGATGPVGVTTCGSSFSTALAIYAGTCDSWTEIACSTTSGGYCTSSGNAAVNFNGTNGVTYYILAGGVNGQAGNLQLQIPQVDLAPTNLTVTNSAGGALTVGKNLSASWLIQNLGSNSVAGTWNDSLSLSNASTNVTLANYNFTHTAPTGGNYPENFNGTIPQIPAGNYSLIIQADAGGLLAESNKLNNFEVLTVFITNTPPSVTLLSPVNTIDRASCVALSFYFLAQTQAGSYNITNVVFYDGSTNNIIGSSAKAPYSLSAPLSFGTHTIGAAAFDNFGLLGITTNTATITLHYPTNLNVLRADVATNGAFVGCMCALTGSNYVVETTTNLSQPTVWLPYMTNLAGSNVLAFTNQLSDMKRYFRVRLLGQ